MTECKVLDSIALVPLTPYNERLRRLAEDRAERMWREREKGRTLQQIAERHGISRQRVHQILHGEAPLPPKRPLSGPRRGR